MHRALLTTALVLAAPASAGAQDFPGARVIGETTRPARVSAYGGVVAWNRYVRGEYRLMVRGPGRRARLLRGPRPKSIPTEFDLGPAPGGGVALVYSRCRFRLTACDLFMQRAGEWRELPIRGASTRRFSEVRPAIWGDQLAFLRIGNRGRRRGESWIRLYVRRLSGGRSRRLPGGPGGDLPAPRNSGIEGLDIGPRGVVFTWISRSRGGTHYRVFVDGLRGGQLVIDEVESPGDRRQMHSASISGSKVSYLEQAQGPGESFTLRQFDLATNTRSQRSLPCAVHSAAADGARFAFLTTRLDCPGVPPGPPRYRIVYGPPPAPSSSR